MRIFVCGAANIGLRQGFLLPSEERRQGDTRFPHYRATTALEILDELNSLLSFSAVVSSPNFGLDHLAQDWANHAGVPFEDCKQLMIDPRKSAADRTKQMLQETTPRLCIAFGVDKSMNKLLLRAKRQRITVMQYDVPSWAKMPFDLIKPSKVACRAPKAIERDQPAAAE